MPTKYPRHAITETPDVQLALDSLRVELDGERPDLRELVILGARAKLDALRRERADPSLAGATLADLIRRRGVPGDPDFADEVRRRGWVRM